MSPHDIYICIYIHIYMSPSSSRFFERSTSVASQPCVRANCTTSPMPAPVISLPAQHHALHAALHCIAWRVTSMVLLSHGANTWCFTWRCRQGFGGQQGTASKAATRPQVLAAGRGCWAGRVVLTGEVQLRQWERLGALVGVGLVLCLCDPVTRTSRPTFSLRLKRAAFTRARPAGSGRRGSCRTCGGP